MAHRQKHSEELQRLTDSIRSESLTLQDLRKFQTILDKEMTRRKKETGTPQADIEALVCQVSEALSCMDDVNKNDIDTRKIERKFTSALRPLVHFSAHARLQAAVQVAECMSAPSGCSNDKWVWNDAVDGYGRGGCIGTAAAEIEAAAEAVAASGKVDAAIASKARQDLETVCKSLEDWGTAGQYEQARKALQELCSSAPRPKPEERRRKRPHAEQSLQVIELE